MTITTAAILLVSACAGEAGDGANGKQTTTTGRPTTTASTTTTTTEPTTTTAPTDDDIPSEGDLAACAPAAEMVAVWTAATVDPAELQSAVNAVLDVGWQAEDTALVAALGQLRTGVNDLDVEGTGTAAVAYSERCTALGVPAT